MCGNKRITYIFTSFWFLLSVTNNTTFSRHLFSRRRLKMVA